jgi:acyl carrier protein
MNNELFDEVARLLKEQFQVDAARVRPDATLESLGLDSLAVMEFVFALEDHFSVRVPEERLDPRHAAITLADLAQAIDDQRLVPAPTQAA